MTQEVPIVKESAILMYTHPYRQFMDGILIATHQILPDLYYSKDLSTSGSFTMVKTNRADILRAFKTQNSAIYVAILRMHAASVCLMTGCTSKGYTTDALDWLFYHNVHKKSETKLTASVLRKDPKHIRD